MNSALGTKNAIGGVERNREFRPATEAWEFEREYLVGISGGAPSVSVNQFRQIPPTINRAKKY